MQRQFLFDREQVDGIRGLTSLTEPGADEPVGAVVDVAVIGARGDGKTQFIVHAIRTLRAYAPPLEGAERTYNRDVLEVVMNAREPRPEATVPGVVPHYVFRIQPHALLAQIGLSRRIALYARAAGLLSHLLVALVNALALAGVLMWLRGSFDAVTAAAAAGVFAVGAGLGMTIARRRFVSRGAIEIVFWDVAGEHVYSSSAVDYYGFLSALVHTRRERASARRSYGFAPVLLCNPLALGTRAQGSSYTRLRHLMPMFASLNEPLPRAMVAINRWAVVEAICPPDSDREQLVAVVPHARSSDSLAASAEGPAAGSEPTTGAPATAGATRDRAPSAPLGPPLPVVKRDVVRKHCLDAEDGRDSDVDFIYLRYDAGMQCEFRARPWTDWGALDADVQTHWQAPGEPAPNVVLDYTYEDGPGAFQGQVRQAFLHWLADLAVHNTGHGGDDAHSEQADTHAGTQADTHAGTHVDRQAGTHVDKPAGAPAAELYRARSAHEAATYEAATRVDVDAAPAQVGLAGTAVPSAVLYAGPGSARGEPAREEPARGEPARGEPARGEPARGEPARGEPARGEPARGGQPPGAAPGQDPHAVPGRAGAGAPGPVPGHAYAAAPTPHAPREHNEHSSLFSLGPTASPAEPAAPSPWAPSPPAPIPLLAARGAAVAPGPPEPARADAQPWGSRPLSANGLEEFARDAIANAISPDDIGDDIDAELDEISPPGPFLPLAGLAGPNQAGDQPAAANAVTEVMAHPQADAALPLTGPALPQDPPPAAEPNDPTLQSPVAGGQTGDLAGDLARGQAGGQTGDLARGQTGDLAHGQTGGQAGDLAHGQTGDLAHGQTGDLAHGQTGGQTDDLARGQTGGHTGGLAGGHTGDLAGGDRETSPSDSDASDPSRSKKNSTLPLSGGFGTSGT